MRNIKLVLEYDGTCYYGWQKQQEANMPTIQGELEKALSVLLGEEIETITAGRTDAGVHAYGQVVNFKTSSDMDLFRIPYSLNAILPNDIVVKKAVEVPENFNARKDPLWREYHYYILNRPYRSVFIDRFVLHEGRSLDVIAMDEAIKVLVGRHDFKSFCTLQKVRKIDSGEIINEKPERDYNSNNNPINNLNTDNLNNLNNFNNPNNTIRTILEASCGYSNDIVWAGEEIEGLITIKLKAHAFLHNMVRIITGTLIEIGLGRRKASDIYKILEAKDRTKAGETAPAKGLTLVKVKYPE